MLSGVAATDWSWGALIFDFENDGNKDIFVSNGILKDIMSMDFHEFYCNEVKGFNSNCQRQNSITRNSLRGIPTQPLQNYAFSILAI